MEKIVEFKNVVKTYACGESVIYACNDVNFELNKGELVVVLGPSGAGKSTILNLLGGMDYPTSGTVIVNGVDISHYKEKQLAKYRAENIGFVFQFYNLIPTLTVYENVSLIKQIVDNPLDPITLLEEVGLKEHENKFPAQLSGGEQQRVSIARALVKNPQLILCDEPTGALDTQTGVVVLKLLVEMCRKNKTVVIVTHNQSIAQMADKVIRIKNGTIESIKVNEKPLDVMEVEW